MLWNLLDCQLFDNLVVKLNVTMALFKLFYIKLDLVRDNNVQSIFFLAIDTCKGIPFIFIFSL